MKYEDVSQKNVALPLGFQDVEKDGKTVREYDYIEDYGMDKRYAVQGDDFQIELPEVALSVPVYNKKKCLFALVEGTIPAQSVSAKLVALALAKQLRTGFNPTDAGQEFAVPTWEQHITPSESKGRSKDPRTAKQKAFAEWIKQQAANAGKQIPGDWNLNDPAFLDNDKRLNVARDKYFGTSDIF